MFKKTIITLIFVSVMLMSALLLSGCGRSAEEITRQTAKENAEMAVENAMPPSVSSAEPEKASSTVPKSAGQSYSTDKAGATPATEQEKIPTKILKTADISYQVEKYAKSRKVILATISRFKGLVSEEHQTNDGYRVVNTMTIRMDAGVFDSLVEALMAEAIYVEHKTITAQDVTEEYIDLAARMKSKKEVEAQYSEILRKARTINEILEVIEYLRAIREEIESVEGRLKYLDNRVSYSTITLTYYEQLDVLSKQPDRTFGSRMGEAFSWGWNGLVTFFLGIIYLWPLWLMLGLTAWLVVWLVKRSNRRHQAAKVAQK